jgi:hypothetical protein
MHPGAHTRCPEDSTTQLGFVVPQLPSPQSLSERQLSFDVSQAKVSPFPPQLVLEPVSLIAQSSPAPQSESTVHRAGTQVPISVPHSQICPLAQPESVTQPEVQLQ